MIVYIYKLLKKGGFRRTALTDLCFLEAGGGEVRKTLSFEPFYTKNDQFAKTGSGQTWGKHSKEMMRCLQALRLVVGGVDGR
jgi:hypothetical protein